MAYTERNWKDASILVCNDVNGTLDIKFSEIKEAIEKDYVVMVKKTVDGVTTFLDVHTINPTERTLKAKGWIYTATSDEAYATGEADESGEGGGGSSGVTRIEVTLEGDGNKGSVSFDYDLTADNYENLVGSILYLDTIAEGNVIQKESCEIFGATVIVNSNTNEIISANVGINGIGPSGQTYTMDYDVEAKKFIDSWDFTS